ncbi:MAG: histidine phosphatase family protein [Flavobacteriales bacterium]
MVRHAKSSWADPGKSDFERPLNERGLRDAPMMAKRFAERKEPVDLMVSSSAARAIATARIFASTLGEMRIREEQDLYLADVRTLMSQIEKLPESSRQAMLFGHNPGLSELVEYLSQTGPGDLPTCAIVRIDFSAESWKEVSGGTGSLAWWDAPKSG